MQMRFTGKYTNGRGTITYLECTFEGHEPREVPAKVAELLAGHPEFEMVAGDPEPIVTVAPFSQPKRRGRRKSN